MVATWNMIIQLQDQINNLKGEVTWLLLVSCFYWSNLGIWSSGENILCHFFVTLKTWSCILTTLMLSQTHDTLQLHSSCFSPPSFIPSSGLLSSQGAAYGPAESLTTRQHNVATDGKWPVPVSVPRPPSSTHAPSLWAREKTRESVITSSPSRCTRTQVAHPL